MSQIYCSVGELLEDLDIEGVRNQSEARILDKLKISSRWIENNVGNFIPITATKNFDGDGTREMNVDPILDVTSILDDITTLGSTEFLLYPLNRLWRNGPYVRIKIDPDATSLYNWSQEDDVIAILGKWGMYEESVSTGATVASQTDSSTALVVDDAHGITPGAVLLIESEQQAVDAFGAATDSTANTSTAMDIDDEQVTVTDGTKVKIGEVIRINFEQMKVIDISGNDILIQRGWNKTMRAAHLTAQDVYVYRTLTVTRGANGTTAAAHTNKAVSRYVVPADILWLCKQMAGLMLRKADSGFSGRVGNDATGETFYFNEFPKTVIEEITARYLVPVL